MKVVRSSPLCTGRLYPQEYPGTHFWRLSRPQGRWKCQLPQNKFQASPPGIDPGSYRFVAQCLNHYATPGLVYLKPHFRSELQLAHMWNVSGQTDVHGDQTQDTVPLWWDKHNHLAQRPQLQGYSVAPETYQLIQEHPCTLPVPWWQSGVHCRPPCPLVKMSQCELQTNTKKLS